MQSDAKNLDQKWKAQMERQEEIEKMGRKNENTR